MDKHSHKTRIYRNVRVEKKKYLTPILKKTLTDNTAACLSLGWLLPGSSRHSENLATSPYVHTFPSTLQGLFFSNRSNIGEEEETQQQVL